MHLINTLKWKSSINKLKPQTAFISTISNTDKKDLLILVSRAKLLTFTIKKDNVTMISIDAYYITCKLKKV